ncbi:MAG: hypothetical protein ABFD06_00335 [Smithella sp.]
MIAVIARKDMSTHQHGAAVDDVLNSPPMRGWHPLAESVPVRRPVSPENIRDVGHDLLKIG